MKFSSDLTALLSATSAALATCAASTNTPSPPPPPTLTHLYTMNCTLAPAITIGDGPIYNRVAIPIVGGTFSGPRGLSGTIADLGADWGVTDKHGVFHPDTRYHLYAGAEKAGIFVQTAGSAQPDGRIQLRMVFETGHPDYYWLNYVVAVGILTAGDGYVLIDAWQVNSPAL
ncbi:uncharacterized protein B0I36DRAFT_274444 [Microdochium trichocladiopsis]|uniref:Uncharacterized protein n=1 Tax=Microdochium trichocladiopsis TaxID=1682393 RepID=A0A9P9BLD4_9PEZI|nr:uncharacterized protein B0I36DRAFT_274444 [Microdochium trichocladiopsis]KAH7024807.1 hypothetical protein B0I36DRAFT_274444 [Microdochium trichocladiopsis]